MKKSTREGRQSRRSGQQTASAKMGAESAGTSLAETIWQWVAAIPPGNVASYGQIARLAGYASHSRYVGSTLKQLPKNTTLPWHRVLRSSGELAFPPASPAWKRQKRLLEGEGVLMKGMKIDLRQYGWQL